MLAEHEEEAAKALSELAGTYLNNRWVFSSFAAVFGLMNAARVTPMTADSITLESAGQSNYLRRLSGDVFEAADGQRVSFVRNEAGHIVALADGMGVHSAERVGWFRSPNTFFLTLGLAGFLARTSALGAWRNLGRGVSGGFASRMAGVGVLVGVLSVTALIGGIVALIIDMAEFDISQMSETYPSAEMFLTHYAGWSVAIASGLMLLAQWPAWSGSAWRIFRRLHFALFTLAMLFLTVMLWQWRGIGAPVI